MKNSEPNNDESESTQVTATYQIVVFKSPLELPKPANGLNHLKWMLRAKP